MDQFKGAVPHRRLHGAALRYVYLSPGNFDEPIVCELVYSTPLDDGSYDALSYAWGDPNETRPITLDGQTFPVTTNLHGALRYLRPAREPGCEPRLLWVDALCINQSDRAERSLLVQRMRDIYRLAGTTIVWLGTPAPLTQADVQAVFDLAATMAEAVASPDRGRILSSQDFSSQNRQALLHMMELVGREWFRRVWVIQEVADSSPTSQETDSSSRRVDVVCGWSTMTLATFAQACRGAGLLAFSPAKNKVGGCPVVNIERVSSISTYLQKQPGLENSLTTAHSLAALLMLSAKAKATDPKDSIYALLGLLPENGVEKLPPELSPNYALTDSDVFHAYAVYLIKEAKFIDMMYFCRASRRLLLPTWVPDWYPTKLITPSSYHISKYFIVSKLARPNLAESNRVLEVDGIDNGTIVAVAPELQSLPRENSNNSNSNTNRAGSNAERKQREWYNHLRSYLLKCSDDFKAALPAVDWDALWPVKRSAWFSNFLRKSRVDSNESEERFLAVLRDPAPSEAVLRDTAPLVDHIATRLWDRQTFIDSNGNINVTTRPSQMSQPLEAGDRLFLLKGSCHQYILRPVVAPAANNTAGQGGAWRLVNATYRAPDPFADFWLDRGISMTKVVRFWEENESRVQRVAIV